MSYLSNIIQRHQQTGNIVAPRTRGVFETPQHMANSIAPSIETESSKTFTKFPNPNSPIESTPFAKQNTKQPGIENAPIQKEAQLNLQNVAAKVVNTPTRVESGQKKKTTSNKGLVRKRNLKQKKISSSTIETKNEPSLIRKKNLDNFLKTKNQQLPAPLRFKKNNPAASLPAILQQMTVYPELKNQKQIISDIIPPSSSENNPIVDNRSDQTTSSEMPTIKIHIGRIDIKAAQQSRMKNSRPTQAPKPGMSLEQFLKEREAKK